MRPFINAFKIYLSNLTDQFERDFLDFNRFVTLPNYTSD